MTTNIEISILGSILLMPSFCMSKALVNVEPAYFNDPRNRRIYEAMITLHTKGISIDTILLGQELKDIPLTYLSSLADSVPTYRHIEDYCVELRNAANKRDILDKIETLKVNMQEGNCPDSDINEFLASISTIKKHDLHKVEWCGDLIDRVYTEIKDGTAYGVLTGYHAMDNATKGLQPQNLIIIASGTSKGKTTFALNIGLNASMLDKGVLFFSLEMSKSEIVKKMISIVAETPVNLSDREIMESCDFGGDEERKAKIRRRFEAAGHISSMPFYIDDRPHTIFSLHNTARDKVIDLQNVGKSVDLIIVDYLQIVKADKNIKAREQQVSDIAHGLKNMAKELNIPVIALAQVNREGDKDKRKYILPDLRESGAIEQDADIVMFLNRDKDDATYYEMDCAKHRNGRTFKFNANFASNYNKFIEIVRDNNY